MATIVTRAGKGSPLTSNEVDANFTNLNSELAGKADSAALSGYLLSTTAASTYQPLDSDLTAIAGITSTSGLLRKTAANTWSLDTNSYLTGITSGQVTSALGFTPENAARKGAANGYASLDGSGLVPAAQLPSYVDDVLEYANLAAFPATGESGKIYVAIDASKTYRWAGSTYVEITASPGSTDAVPEGSTNLYFTTARARSSISASGSLAYNSTTGVVSYTAPTAVSAFTNDAGYLTGITGTQVTTALGYTPYNATNPSGYTSNTGTVTSVSGTGTVNGLTLTGTVTSSGSLTLGGTLSVDLSTVTVTGTLPVTKGGTGTATQFTAGSVVFAGTSGVYTQDNANLFWDDTNNRLGIGTASPGTKLDVVGGGRFSANVSIGNSLSSGYGVSTGDTSISLGGERTGDGNSYIDFNSASGVSYETRMIRSPGADGAFALSNRGTGNMTIGQEGAAPLIFSTSSAERARIDSAGNLGLGVTPSAWGAGYRAFQLGPNGNFVTVGLNISFVNNGYNDGTGYKYQATNPAASYEIAQNLHRWYTAPSGTAGTAISFTQAMTLDASGRLSIGTTSSNGRLTVAGAGNATVGYFSGNTTSNAVSDIYVARTGTVTNNIGQAANIQFVNATTLDQGMLQSADSGFQFWSNPLGGGWVERMRINSIGNVGIGVTPSAWETTYGSKALQIGAFASTHYDGYNGATVLSANSCQSGATTFTYIGSVGAAKYTVSTGAGHYWDIAPVGTAGNAISFTRAMTLNTSGNLGIGTSGPAQKLQVHGLVAVSNQGDGFSAHGAIGGEAADNSNGALLLYSHTANALTEKARITHTGNFGIGTSSPAAKLTVSGGDIRLDNGEGLEWGGSNNAIVGNASTGVITIATNGSERARIDSAGNFGIGTSSPSYKLEVVGQSLIHGNVTIGSSLSTGYGVSTGGVALELGGERTGNGPTYIDFHSAAGTDYEARIERGSGANSYFDIFNTGTGQITIGQTGAAPIVFYTSNTERARIDASGNLGIGTTSPGSPLDVNGSARVRGDLNVYGTGDRLTITPQAAGSGVLTVAVSNGNTAYAPNLIDGSINVFRTGGSERMRVHSSGGVSIGTTTDPGAGNLNLSGKIIPGVQSTTSTATLTPNANSNNIASLSAQAVALTIAAPSGTASDGQKMVIRIKDNGSSQTINWNGIYVAAGATLPTATTAGKWHHIGLIYNTNTTTWMCVAAVVQA